MPRVNYRLARVAETLQRELALLIRQEMADSRVKTVTLSRVKMSPDLHHARVFFTTPEEAQAKTVGKALNHAVSYLRRRIAAIMQLRIVPELHFEYDTALLEAERLTRLIDTVAHVDKNDEDNIP